MRPLKAFILVVASILSSAPQQAAAGPIVYGMCQTGCNVVVAARYAAAGFTSGTIAAPVAVPAISTRNAAFGICSAACAAVASTPTP
ncbi:hypothetical protein AN958_00094 [Leucoagaricus sp. SymC.cos]|nr:hypothetical protein AN958_00094 [Leucoagaricus sp. SymC.cos]